MKNKNYVPKSKGTTKIQRILNGQQMTQKQLCDRINEKFTDSITSLDTISRYCSGNRTNVHLSTIRKMCFILQVTPNEIIDDHLINDNE